jgi:predicted metal-dependent phosphoesterase TrpH
LDSLCRESYNEPLEVYATLKARGMDLVTVTDHDSIDAAEDLRQFPDFFLSEEVTCTMPSGTELHVGVYGITEADHLEIQRRRTDLCSLIAYLNEKSILFSANHVFSCLTGRRVDEDFAFIAREFSVLESRNGQLLETCNRSAAELAARWRKAVVAGSDAHTLESLGKTYTQVHGARTSSEFLDGVRRSAATTVGDSGDCIKLTRALLTIGRGMARESPWVQIFAPLLIFVPLIAMANSASERMFNRKWANMKLGTVHSIPNFRRSAPIVAGPSEIGD